MEAKLISIIGARQHNLRNVSVDLPRERLTVFTGLSGSGKSSLAFDTIHAEGQRRYVESVSVHARHFLEQVGKPEVERIEGLPPTLAIEQRAAGVSPRSTVATTTEIYDFLRVLFARVGTPCCPQCGRRIHRHTVDQIVDAVLSHDETTRILVLAPLLRVADARPGNHARGPSDVKAVLRRIQREGFVRARVNGELRDVKELSELREAAAGGDAADDIDVVVDRLILRPDIRSRLADAVELAFTLGDGTVIVSRATDDQNTTADGSWVDETFSEHHACTTCGTSIRELSPRAFSFNSPYGACEQCGGLGTELSFDEQLIVPDEEMPLASGAIAPWRSATKPVAANYRKLIGTLCAAFDVRPQTRFNKLPDDLRRIILHGSRPKDVQKRGIEFEGVIPNLQRRQRASGSGGARNRLAAFQSEHICEECHGARLRPEALAVRVGLDDKPVSSDNPGHNINDIVRLSIGTASHFFDELRFAGEAEHVAEPILREVRQRLHFMDGVGLGYLTLDRGSATLSGGEAQRIRLATQLGSGLVGVCYVLDEPTIGLHQRDNERLLSAGSDISWTSATRLSSSSTTRT